MSKVNKKGVSGWLICLEIIVAIIWLTQFIMAIVYRFSHTGKVCSGDYSKDQMINEDTEVADSKYNIYYLRQEGDFLYYYMVTCGVVLLIFLILACCVGTILFGAGSLAALKMAEGILMNLDNLPEMMRQGGPPPPSDNRFRRQPEEQKFEDEFNNI